MTNLTLEEFTRLIVRKIEELGTEVVLQNPTSQAVFPLKVVRLPLENILKTEDGTPVKKRFSVTVEEWSNKKYICMQMAEQTSQKLLEYNLTKSNNDIDQYDEITKKYRLISTYEVYYNGIYNSFEITK